MDLKLGSIPLTVQGRFFLMALLFGLNERDPARLATFVAVVFVSIVVHEMGHALMGMAFGYKPAIVLHGMGGHTTFGGGRWTETTGRSVLISLAGPFAGFVFAGIIIAVQAFGGLHPELPIARYALLMLLEINIVWGIFNLIPMLPLDGGNVMRSVFHHFSTRRGEHIARIVSLICAVAMGAYAVRGGQWWLLYLAALYGYQNFLAFRGEGGATDEDAPRVVAAGGGRSLSGAVEQAYGALNRGDTKEAIALLGPVLFAKGIDPEVKRSALEVYVVALIKEERWSDVVRTIEREKDLVTGDSARTYATMLRKAGRMAEASVVEAIGKRAASFGEFRA